MKVLYLVVQQKRRSGGGITGRVYGWVEAVNALILAYNDPDHYLTTSITPPTQKRKRHTPAFGKACPVGPLSGVEV